MKTVGLITEYNPFHNGHLYHLNESKKITECDYSIAIMSGNFVQRGEPAIVDKWTRAKMAVDSGVDLVIELPFIYASQSAELFAYGAVNTLDKLGIVNSLCFGSEIGNIDILKSISSVLVKEPDLYRSYLKNSLDNGNSFPKAREYALVEYFKTSNFNDWHSIKNILTNPNNILAIEYLKAIQLLNSNIIPFTISRLTSNYHDKNLSGEISSATAIRKELFNNTNIESLSYAIPNSTYLYIKEYLESGKQFNSLNNFSQIITYLIRELGENKLKSIMDIEGGLERRFMRCSEKYFSIDNLIECISTKRYTNSRLKRILIHLLVGLDQETFKQLHKFGPQYIRVLATNEKGLYLLKEIKKKNTIEIVTKFADYKKFKNPILNRMIELDRKATDIYFLGLKSEKSISNLDYKISPYIKRLS